MMPDQVENSLARILRFLSNDSRDPIELSGWYCVSQWLNRFFGTLNLPVHSGNVSVIAADNQFKDYLRRFKLDKYPVNEKATALTELVHFIRNCNLTNNRAVLFYDDYLCGCVSDSTYLGLGKIVYDAPTACSLIRLCMVYAGTFLGTGEIFSLISSDVYREHQDDLAWFHITEEEFDFCWKCVHCCDTPSFFDPLTKVLDAAKVYAKYKAPKTYLLEQYALVKGLDINAIKASNQPLEYIYKNSGRRVVEGGLSLEDKEFLDSAYQISLEDPTDVVQTLFFSKRDDSRIECMVAKTEIKRKQWFVNDILIVNPSPMFLAEYSKVESDKYKWIKSFEDNREEKDQGENQPGLQSNTTIVVRDEILCGIYSQQFPRYEFVTIGDLKNLQQKYGYVAVFARDHQDRNALWNAFEKCQHGGYVTALIPQTCITHKDETFVARCSANQIHFKTIMDIPEKVCQTEPKKKLLLHGCRGEYFSRMIRLISTTAHNTGEWLIPQKKFYVVPEDILSMGMTFAQMRMVDK